MRSALRSLVPCALLLIGAVACGEHSATTAPSAVTTPAASLLKLTDAKSAKVATCKPQKEQFKTVTVDSKGGEVKIGENRLVIPTGALSQPTRIDAHMPPTETAQVEFSPEGLQFAVPATLTLSYASCATPLLGVIIAYVRADTVTEVEPSRDQVLVRKVTAPINHFSSYAVAY